MKTQYDAIIIGGGQAGPPLAHRLATKGQRVAIIERNLFGGTCLNTGCVPTKALIECARSVYMAKHAKPFGINISQVDVDIKKVKERMREVQQHYQPNIEPWLRNTPNCTVYHGAASFVDDHTVKVDDDLLIGKQIFINVGGRALVPPMPGLEKIKYYTNSTFLDMDNVPEHLIIVGGSYIGLEFAQMYRRFGSEVTILEKANRLIAREDEDVSHAIQDIMEKEGIHLRLQSECISFEKRGEKIVTKLDCKDSNKEVVGTDVLLAIGRVPNTQDLGLANAGVTTDAQGYIPVNELLQTNVSHIYALGDCNRRGAFTHTAYNDYEIVAANLLNDENRKVSERITTYALFTDPPLGRAGLTEEQVRQTGKKGLIAKLPMSKVKRAFIKNETDGFMKIVIDADTKLILGAAILGVEGDEIIHSVLDVMYSNEPYTKLEHAMHIHPTISELIPTMLEEDVEPMK